MDNTEEIRKDIDYLEDQLTKVVDILDIMSDNLLKLKESDKVEELEKRINELEDALLSVTMALKAVSSSVGGLTNVTEKIVERMNSHV